MQIKFINGVLDMDDPKFIPTPSFGKKKRPKEDIPVHLKNIKINYNNFKFNSQKNIYNRNDETTSL